MEGRGVFLLGFLAVLALKGGALLGVLLHGRR